MKQIEIFCDSWRTRLLDLFMYARENRGYRNRLNVNQQYVSSMILTFLLFKLSSSGPDQNSDHSNSFHSFIHRYSKLNESGADIKIIFAPHPTPPHPTTMKLFLMEMDSRAYSKTFLLWWHGVNTQGIKRYSLFL